MDHPTVGILPMWLKLYDDLGEEFRPRIEEFVRTIAGAFERRGVWPVCAPVCRITTEFGAAVKRLEAARVDAIVTLHLAYSPSLESSGALARTRLPLLVLDTTPSWSYGPIQDPREMMYNHGIHGVQDMCNLLVRGRRPFLIEAGHWERSDVIDRIAGYLPGARMAATVGRGRVGLMGNSFAGMGDFYTPPARLKAALGASVMTLDTQTLKALLASVKAAEIQAELEADRERFVVASGCEEAHRRSARLGLAIRRWVEHEKLDAFSFNFMDMKRSKGYPTVPFLEASKAMARGVGYAGEGDVLTALLVGAVSATCKDTTFTEMFCPDWETGAVYLSHMGELNWRLVQGKAVLREMSYRFSPTGSPAFLTGRFRPGDVVLVNLAPVPDGGYRLILVPATMLEVAGEDRMEGSVRGWFRPRPNLPDFLADYSRLGGTHHLALAYTGSTRDLETLGRLMGWETVVIR